VNQALEFCRAHDLTLIEDAAHAAGPSPAIGAADFVVYSPRKLFAIPSGGSLVSRRSAEGGREAESRSIRSWIVRRLIQKALRAVRVPWHKVGAGLSAQTPARMMRGPVPATGEWFLDPIAGAWLDRAVSAGSGVVARRRANYRQLLAAIGSAGEFEPLMSDLPDTTCPYALPMRLKVDVARVAKSLQDAGVPASRWPDLPEEVTQSPETFPVSNQLFSQVLLLPVHQGLQAGELQRVAALFRRTVDAEAGRR
jgi:dTDP-4-amino-4,6-dideoxygalactose transaminase